MKTTSKATKPRSTQRTSPHAVRKTTLSTNALEWLRHFSMPAVFDTCFFWLKNLLLIALILGAISAGLVWLQRPDTLPVKVVRIIGNQQTLSQDLQHALVPYTQGGFFSVNLQKIRNTALQLPWVKNAQIYRQWPDTVLVKLTEHQPLARWQPLAQDANPPQPLETVMLVNQEGNLFQVPAHDHPAGLPLFVGTTQQHAKILKNFQLVQPLLQETELKIHEFGFNPQQAWYIVLQHKLLQPQAGLLPSHGALSTQFKVLLGQLPSEAGMQRFLNFYHYLQQQNYSALPSVAKNIATAVKVQVDVRYQHGVAVRIISEEDYAT